MPDVGKLTSEHLHTRGVLGNPGKRNELLMYILGVVVDDSAKSAHRLYTVYLIEADSMKIDLGQKLHQIMVEEKLLNSLCHKCLRDSLYMQIS